MSSGIYSPSDLELIFEGKTFESVFGILRRIWNPENKSISKYYRDGEIDTNRLEETLLELYPALYDELLERCMAENVAEITRKKKRYCLVIMDSLSLREAMLLENDLKEKYTVELSYSFSPLPSETESFKQKVFGRTNISQWDNPDFKYLHDLSGISVLPESDTLTIWTQAPDDKLHHTRSGHSEPWSMDDVYADTQQLVHEILKTCRHDDVIITSDHGYVDLTASCTFQITNEWKELLRNQFKNRWRAKENNWELEQLYERGLIRYAGEYYVVAGRYSWTTGRGSVNARKHGGLSIMECMTPVLNVKVN